MNHVERSSRAGAVRTAVPAAVPAAVHTTVHAAVHATLHVTVPATVHTTVPAAVHTTLPAALHATVPAALHTTLPAALHATLPAALHATVPATVRASVQRAVRAAGRAMRRCTVPAAVLALVLIATAFAAESWDTPPGAGEEVVTAAPPIAVDVVVDVLGLERAAGPELSALALDQATGAIVRFRPKLERWLCTQLQEGRAGGLVDGCPAGGVVLAGPEGQARCTVHGTATDRGAGVQAVQPGGEKRTAVAVALAAVERVRLTVYLDGATLMPQAQRGGATVDLTAGSDALARLGVKAAGDASFEVERGGAPVRVDLARTASGLAAEWTPLSGPPGNPRRLATLSAGMPAKRAAGEDLEPVLARVSVPIGVPMWRVFEARIPGNVGLGRPPRSMTVSFRATSIEVRVQHDSEAAVLNLDSNLSTGLSVLKVATAFKRRGGIDQVFEFLFRAPRRMEETDLVIEGPWPPELKGGLVAALESAVEHGPASREIVAAACRLRCVVLERAVSAWEAERGAALSGSVTRLVDEGLIERVPACPQGAMLLVDDGRVQCSLHRGFPSPF